MTAYYNEIDPYAAQWLRNLMANDLIAWGDVDERDIRDIDPNDLRGYTQCHFFAGIGGWSLALRLAGWPDDEPVWTGSCPCQPFSAAGRSLGFADERHLWPSWFHLILERRPATIFGEQVASKDGLGWLALVQADMEASGHRVGAADLCAAGVGAPHRRQRLWFVADADGGHPRAEREQSCGEYGQQPAHGGALLRLADSSSSTGLEGRDTREVGNELTAPERSGEARGLEHASCDGWLERRAEPSGRGVVGGRGAGCVEHTPSEQVGFPGCTWFDGRAADWIPCQDGKWRPVEPGTFPLAHGVSNRVGLLRGYGNAIVPQVAAQFIQAYRECRP